MNALRDPFSRVHPLFWPVLWLSLRAFVHWTGKLIEEGHGFAGLSIEITWYGVIRVVTLDLSAARAGLNRYLAGAPPAPSWRDGLFGDGSRLWWSEDGATCAPLSRSRERGGREGRGAASRTVLRVVMAASAPLAPLSQPKEGDASWMVRAVFDTS